MQTMDSALTELVRQGKITRDVAKRRASVPAELSRLLGETLTAVDGTAGNGYLQ